MCQPYTESATAPSDYETLFFQSLIPIISLAKVDEVINEKLTGSLYWRVEQCANPT